MSRDLRLIGRLRDALNAANVDTVATNIDLLTDIGAALPAILAALTVQAPVKKVAVSGSPHPVYGQLTMANADTEATIPGSGVLSETSIVVTVGGLIQTDFTFSGRTLTLAFTPTLTDQNRMVIQYEEL